MKKSSEEHGMTNENKLDTEQENAVSMESRWKSCESLGEAKRLVEYMMTVRTDTDPCVVAAVLRVEPTVVAHDCP